MSEQEKGEILKNVSELPPMQKERALGFLQGLVAASVDQHAEAKDGSEEKEDQDNDA